MAGPKGKGPGLAKGKTSNVKPKPAPVIEQAPSSEELFSRLDASIKKMDYKKIVKASDEILAQSPGDEAALQCKVVALIQDGQLAEAERVIEEHGSPQTLNLHKAYCLYRSNQLPKALEAAAAAGRSPAVLQLEAQILYRLGDSAACIQRYEELKSLGHLESEEIKTNVIAAYVGGGRASEVPALLKSLRVAPRDSFDVAYNAACALVENGELQKAEEMLLLAKRVGQEQLVEEELKEEEVEDELAPISVQLAYVQQALKQPSEAMAGYTAVLKRKVADVSSMAVATNNLVALRGAKELFDSLKRMDKVVDREESTGTLQFADGLDSKLAPRQKGAMAFNRALLLLHSNKLDQARALLSGVRAVHPNNEAAQLLEAAVLMKQGKHAEVQAVVSPQEEGVAMSTEAQLIWVQAAATAGMYAEAAVALEQVEEVQHHLATVATLVALKEQAGDVEGATATLLAAVNWWDSRMDGEGSGALLPTRSSLDGPPVTEQRQVVLQEAAQFLLTHERHQEARTLWERLLKGAANPAVRAEALHGLIACTAELDPAAAERYEAELPPMPGAASLDPEALENSGSTISLSKAGKRPAVTEAGTEGDDEPEATKKPKKKRKRKIMYPKGFDPANPGPPPDPERWLPKRERSTYKPKKKDKRNNAQIRGAQGAMAREKPGEGTNLASASTAAVGSAKVGTSGAGKGSKVAPVAAAGGKSDVGPPSKKKGKKGRR